MAASSAAWEVLEKTANVAQVISVLVTLFTSLLRLQQSNKRECAKLDRCTRRLRSLLQWPATGALLCSEMGGPVILALGDAARLVDSYKKSTLWRRLWSAGRMATQLRDMQDVIDSYCGLLLFVNAYILLQQQAVYHHPPSPDTSSTTTTIPEMNDTSQSPSEQAGTSCSAVAGTRATERANDVGQGGMDSDPAGCERNVPALLPIVIFHA